MSSEAFLVVVAAIMAIMLFSFLNLLQSIKKEDRKRILTYKTLCSLMFWCFGFLCVLYRGNGLTAVSSLMVAGFSCSLAGDVFLVYKRKRCFAAGLASFFLAHVCFSLAFITRNGFSLRNLILFAGVSALPLYFINRPGYLRLGSMKWPGHAYLLILSFMLSNAVAGAVFQAASLGSSLPSLAGALLFFISDMLLAYRHFGVSIKRSFHGVSLAAYYSAQLLLSLGMLFM